VAEFIAMVFPTKLDFALEIMRGFEMKPSDFHFGRYPDDQLIYRTPTALRYTTPAWKEGLGTKSWLKANDRPIQGAALLTGEFPDLLHLAVRLPDHQAALAAAINSAHETFRIVEIGAGWAPWAVAGIVQARRRGLRAKGLAVEADAQRSQWAMQHAADNDVSAEFVTGTPEEITRRLREPFDGVELRVVQAAGWHTSTILQFPELDEGDMGGAVWTLPGTDVDYRGAHLAHIDVPTVAIADLLDTCELTDLLHIDVQGVEFELVQPASDVIQQKVRLMAIGTTDRLTEGRLQDHFLPRGWGLAIDEPCKAVFTMTHPTLAGFTVQDGTQLWENPFVRRDFPG
jgi:hypothetical protein